LDIFAFPEERQNKRSLFEGKAFYLVVLIPSSSLRTNPSGISWYGPAEQNSTVQVFAQSHRIISASGGLVFLSFIWKLRKRSCKSCWSCL